MKKFPFSLSWKLTLCSILMMLLMWAAVGVVLVLNTAEEIMAAQKLLGRTCGVFGEPAGVTGAAGVKKLCEQGVIGKDDTVVSVVTGNGLKDVANAIKAAGEPISIPSDMDRLLAAFAEKGITVE